MTDADEILTTQRFSARPMLSIDAADLRRLLDERARLREQRDELQASNTRLLLENRAMQVRLAAAHCAQDLLSESFHLPTAVREFMSAAGQEMPAGPTVPRDEVVRLRLRLIAEEFCELLDAFTVHDGSMAIHYLNDIIGRAKADGADLVEAADALADIAYVVEGTCLAFGLDSDALGAEVHRSNRTKDFSNVPAGGKVTKGPAFSPPDIAGVLGLPKEAA